MTSRIYKTAQGQTVDLGALALKNEKTLAVSPGGGKVNARGDRLDDNNNVIDSKAAQVGRQMREQTQQVATSQRVYSSTREMNAAKNQYAQPAVAKANPKVADKIEISEELIAGLDDIDEAINEPNPVKVESVENNPSKSLDTTNEGLAAAIAKAKSKKAQ